MPKDNLFRRILCVAGLGVPGGNLRAYEQVVGRGYHNVLHGHMLNDELVHTEDF